MTMHHCFPITGPPAKTYRTDTANITLLGNLAAIGCTKSLRRLQLLALIGHQDATQELRSIKHLLAKDTNHAKRIR